MATVARIGVTPLKGTRLLHPAAVELTPLGIPGNRRYHLVNERGELFSCGDFGPLMRVAAAFDAATETLVLDLPGGTRVEAGPHDLGAAHVTDFYGRPVPGRFVEGPAEAALSSYVGRQLRLVRADAEGDGPDVHRLTLVSLASVEDLGARHGRPELGPGRFRMNLELDRLRAIRGGRLVGRRRAGRDGGDPCPGAGARAASPPPATTRPGQGLRHAQGDQRLPVG